MPMMDPNQYYTKSDVNCMLGKLIDVLTEELEVISSTFSDTGHYKLQQKAFDGLVEELTKFKTEWGLLF
jgi:hypothetical protein